MTLARRGRSQTWARQHSILDSRLSFTIQEVGGGASLAGPFEAGKELVLGTILTGFSILKSSTAENPIRTWWLFHPMAAAGSPVPQRGQASIMQVSIMKGQPTMPR